MAKKQQAPEEVQIDGYYVREGLIKAPGGDVRLVIKRADNHTNLLIAQTLGRLLAYMRGQHRLTNDPGGQVSADLKRYVANFLTCAAQTVIAEGLPGFDDWGEVDLGLGNPRLLDAFDRWMGLDGALTNRWIALLNAVDAMPEAELDPKEPPSGDGSGGGTAS
jgi:hypothetical protein